MLKKFLAPFLVLSVVLTLLTIGNSNSDLSQISEVEKDYFIKPINTASVAVVEPNYGRFYNPNAAIEADASGKVLYDSLDELEQIYDINSTKMVRFERKGQMIPNLYVSVDSTRMPESLAYGVLNDDA